MSIPRLLVFSLPWLLLAEAAAQVPLAMPAGDPAPTAGEEQGSGAPAAAASSGETSPPGVEDGSPAGDGGRENDAGGATLQEEVQAPAAVAPPPRERKMRLRQGSGSIRGLFGRYSRELLAIAGLLVLLLIRRLTYLPPQEEHTRTPPARRAPINPEELGFAVFHALRSKNLEAFRSLFLNGVEAVQVLGRKAGETYLDRRTHALLQDSFTSLLERIPDEVTFHCSSLERDGSFKISLLRADRRQVEVPVGTAIQVGRVLRLHEPKLPPGHPGQAHKTLPTVAAPPG